MCMVKAEVVEAEEKSINIMVVMKREGAAKPKPKPTTAAVNPPEVGLGWGRHGIYFFLYLFMCVYMSVNMVVVEDEWARERRSREQSGSHQFRSSVRSTTTNL